MSMLVQTMENATIPELTFREKNKYCCSDCKYCTVEFCDAYCCNGCCGLCNFCRNFYGCICISCCKKST